MNLFNAYHNHMSGDNASKTKGNNKNLSWMKESKKILLVVSIWITMIIPYCDASLSPSFPPLLSWVRNHRMNNIDKGSHFTKTRRRRGMFGLSFRGGDGSDTALTPILQQHNGTDGLSNEEDSSLSYDSDDCRNEKEDYATAREAEKKVIYVTKRDGSNQELNHTKILDRLRHQSQSLDKRYINLQSLASKISQGTYPNITTKEIDILTSETAASMSTQHPHYGTLAARICVSACHKHTPQRFSEAIGKLYDEGRGFISPRIYDVVNRFSERIDAFIHPERDYDLTYFGFKTLERAYLLKSDDGVVVERPQYLLMRVALGIHCSCPSPGEEEVKEALETYDLMSRGYFTHATPTLFYSGTIHPQLSSCFLVQMKEDSICGIYDTLKTCAVISKAAGGIGLSVHNIRARGTYIQGTRGISNGLVPMLRVFDVTSRYVDQGGGKRPGAFAIYLEPWHADIFDVLNLKKNHGKEEQRARDLFYGLWVPDLFMKRVQENGMWSLMCPHQCPGLSSSHGEEFELLYKKYEESGKVVRTVKARDLWYAILDAQIETGTPYLLYKDSCNAKSNQKNLGTIQCSNLCTEIIQYTNETEVAVCNLASICLPKFVVSSRGPYGSINPSSSSQQANSTAYFDHEALHKAVKIVTRNLNKVIDTNQYPTEGSKISNHRHRPIGIGVSGLADAFIRLGMPFTSKEAKVLNEAIFETIYHAALEASTELAERDGPYPTFSGSPASQGLLQFQLWGMEDEQTPSYVLQQQQQNSTSTHHHHYSKECINGYNWKALRQRIMDKGLRNSLLIAPMPTASTSQILGVNECFEPYVSNLYLRRVKAGEFIMANPHLLQDLSDCGLWNSTIRNQLMRDGGSVAFMDCIPQRLKEIYKTVWEIKMKDVIDMAADRGKFIDQSQSMNLFIADPTVDKLTAMHFYAWKKGLKTGMYYLRTRPAVNAIQYTVDKEGTANNDDTSIDDSLMENFCRQQQQQEDNICLSCQA